jgi:excisionase family DNA binding protein
MTALNSDMLTFEEAAIYLKVSKSFLYKATSERTITFFKPSGKIIRFKRQDLDAWLIQNCHESKTTITSKFEKK